MVSSAALPNAVGLRGLLRCAECCRKPRQDFRLWTMLLLRGNRAGDRFRTQAIEGRSNSSFAYLISRLGRRFKDCFQLNGRPERKARHSEHETRRQLVIPENVAEKLRGGIGNFHEAQISSGIPSPDRQRTESDRRAWAGPHHRPRRAEIRSAVHRGF